MNEWTERQINRYSVDGYEDGASDLYLSYHVNILTTRTSLAVKKNPDILSVPINIFNDYRFIISL